MILNKFYWLKVLKSILDEINKWKSIGIEFSKALIVGKWLYSYIFKQSHAFFLPLTTFFLAVVAFFTTFFGAGFFGAAFLAIFFGTFFGAAINRKEYRLGHQRLLEIFLNSRSQI